MLDRIERGPGALLRPFVVVGFGAALLAILIALVVRPSGQLPPRQLVVLALALTAAAAAIVLLLLWPQVGVRLEAWFDRRRHRDLASVALLVATAGATLLVVPTYFFVRSTTATGSEWAIYGGVDRRWMTSLFLLGALGPAVLGTLAAALIRVAAHRPTTWRALVQSVPVRSATEAAAPSEPRSRRANALTAAKVALGLGIAYYFYGPPWYLSAYHGGIDYHEDVWLAGLQAIARGNVPYIYAANVQYGPGSQLAMYGYMRSIGGFTIIGFRETFALFQWAGASIFFAVLFARFRLVWGLVTGLLAVLVFPTLQMLRFVDHSTYFGFFGWGDVLRYAGVFALALLYSPTIERSSKRSRLLAGLALGIFWGASAFMAQENLAGGVLVLVVLTILFLASRTYTLEAVFSAAGGIVLGIVLIWLPIVGYYAWHRALVLFVRLYLLVPLAVARGYSNTPYLEGRRSPWWPMYYFLPVVLAALALLAVVQLHPLRLAERWERERTLLVSVVVVAVVADQASMLRADQSHLVNTMLAVPVVFVSAGLLLPRTLGLRNRGPAVVVRCLVVGVAVLLVPRSMIQPQALRQVLLAPYDDRRDLSAQHQQPAPPTGAGARLGSGLVSAALCCSSSTVSMRELIHVMNRIHGVVGDRTTYVNGFRDGYPGLVYFLADLRPAPSFLDPYTMAITPALVRESLDYFRRHIRAVAAEVVSNPKSEEALDFKAAYPRYRLVKISYPRGPIYIFLRGARRS
jgi:hypothetical protein